MSSVLPRAHRSALASFRCGTAPIRLETGRYENLPEKRRTCPFCPNIIESEQHVLISCPVYDDIRDDLFNAAESAYPDFIHLSEADKLTLILSGELLVTRSARACRNILNHRNGLIYR